MAVRVPEVKLEGERFERLLEALERMAAGEIELRLPISSERDNLDAIAYGVNVLVGELRYAGQSMRRAKEEADRANQAKSTFLRNVSHELRTPLAAIVSLIELLAGDVTADRVADLASRLRTNAHALLKLVDDLLDLSKAEAGRLAIELKPTAPVELAREVVHSLGSLAGERQVSLSVTERLPLPSVISSDPVRLRQILMNLVANALKFTPRGSIEVLLARHGDRLAIDVIDSGIGLSDAQQKGLFEPLHQVDPRSYGGSGLGLALSRRLAEALGGELELVSSAPEKGSTFRLLVPIGAVQAEAPRSASKLLSQRPLLQRRLLLADDNQDIRHALTALLELAGASVVQADGGVQALELASSQRFDLLLLDLRMPDIDGIEVAQKLRAVGWKTPILVLTGDVSDERRTIAGEAGINDYLAKPVEYQELIDRLVRLLPR